MHLKTITVPYIVRITVPRKTCCHTSTSVYQAPLNSNMRKWQSVFLNEVQTSHVSFVNWFKVALNWQIVTGMTPSWFVSLNFSEQCHLFQVDQHLTFLTQSSHDSKCVPLVPQYTAAIKNTWASTTLFPIELQWLLKWRWHCDCWCWLYCCMHKFSSIPWQQCMQSADHLNRGQATENHLRLQLLLWLMPLWFEIVAASSGSLWQWSSNYQFHFLSVMFGVPVLYCTMSSAVCHVDRAQSLLLQFLH